VKITLQTNIMLRCTTQHDTTKAIGYARWRQITLFSANFMELNGTEKNSGTWWNFVTGMMERNNCGKTQDRENAHIRNTIAALNVQSYKSLIFISFRKCCSRYKFQPLDCIIFSLVREVVVVHHQTLSVPDTRRRYVSTGHSRMSVMW